MFRPSTGAASEAEGATHADAAQAAIPLTSPNLPQALQLSPPGMLISEAMLSILCVMVLA